MLSVGVGSVAAINLCQHGENGNTYRVGELPGGVRSVEWRNMDESTVTATDGH